MGGQSIEQERAWVTRPAKAGIGEAPARTLETCPTPGGPSGPARFRQGPRLSEVTRKPLPGCFPEKIRAPDKTMGNT